MSEILRVVLLTVVAGGAIPLGGFLARIENLHPAWLEREFRHGVIAFGGGALLAAVALVLVPEGINNLPGWTGMASLMLGGVAFMQLDVLLHRLRTPASQLAATLADFLPEAAALGASLATGGPNAALLALLIAMQNLPEGFNAYRELRQGGFGSRIVLTGFVLAALLGPAAGLLG
ncbi:MAG: divalent cation transporter, partial [Phycisphaeraceae bacterium]